MSIGPERTRIEMVKIEHDERFEKMFKELDNDPEYLEELRKIEEMEKRYGAKKYRKDI